ncbi:hypothetical protein JCM10213_005164 [Rhodosporidiobolus nylandii]
MEDVAMASVGRRSSLCDDLLRLVAALVPQLSSTAVNERGVAFVAGELGSLLEEHRSALDANILHPLESALISLSSVSGVVPFPSCTSALASLSSAIHLLASTSQPVPAAHRLPVEILRWIAEVGQGLEPVERQRLNLSLAPTCRTFYSIVKPHLADMLAISSARQLEHLADGIWSAEPVQAWRGVRTLVFDLALKDVELQADGRWPGQHLFTIIDRCGRLDALQVTLRGQKGEANSDILQATGQTYERFEELFRSAGIRDLRLDLAGDFGANEYVRDVFATPGGRGVIHLGATSLPQVVHPGEVAEALQVVEFDAARDPDSLVDNSSVKELVLPWHPFTLAELLFILRPPPTLDPRPPPPQLEHLAITLDLGDCGEESERNLVDVFASLSPSIRRLSLRVLSTPPVWGTETQARLQAVMAEGLGQCRQLEHLKYGAPHLPFHWDASLLAHPTLRTITFLHFNPLDPLDHYLSFVQALEDSPLDSITLGIPSVAADYDEAGSWTMDDMRMLSEACEELDVIFRIKTRPAEAQWWKQVAGPF